MQVQRPEADCFESAEVMYVSDSLRGVDVLGRNGSLQGDLV